MKYYPLTIFQKTITCVEGFMDISFFNISCIVYYKNKRNPLLLQRAINNVIEKNDALRIRLTKVDGDVMQYIFPCYDIKFDILDFSCDKNISWLNNWMMREDKKPMQVYDGDLFRFVILQLDGKSACFIKIHHVICDGWSLSLIKQQINDEYNALTGELNHIDTEKPSYFEFIKRQNEYVKSEKYEKTQEFWKQKMMPPAIATSFKPEKILKTYLDCGDIEFIFPCNIHGRLNEFCKEKNISVLVFFISILMLYLFKINSNEDVLAATHFHNRLTPEENDTIGCFAVTLPLRININIHVSFNHFLRKVMSELKSAIKHRNFTLQLIMDEMTKEAVRLGILEEKKESKHTTDKYKGHIPLKSIVNTIVSYENYNDNEMVDYVKKNEDCFELSIKIRLSDDSKLILEFIYLKELFDKEEIEHIYGNIIDVAKEVLMNPDKQLHELISEYIK